QPAASSAPGSTSLAGDWRYLPDESGRDLAGADLDDAAWPTMSLPSNWFLKGHHAYPTAIDLQPPPGGAVGNWGETGQPAAERGLDYSGHVWFRRHVMQAAAGSTPVLLRFDTVD